MIPWWLDWDKSTVLYLAALTRSCQQARVKIELLEKEGTWCSDGWAWRVNVG